MSNFRVAQFSDEDLFTSLANDYATPDEVAAHDHAAYLRGYLSSIGARTIVVESPYVDGDYLDDFASYYVKCFTTYSRWCRRIHFFSASFSDQDILDVIRGDDAKRLENSYLGFIVARPLPQTIIGRTVLGTFPDDNGRRQFPCIAAYPVNFFGVTLTVRSLPFEEQDTVLAACATVALWSCFQKTAELFGTRAPSPAVITRSASEAVHLGRPIPSRGLKIEEICTAIRYAGLEPEVVDLSEERVPLISLLYSYLTAGLPVILVVQIGGLPDDGYHAITLAGYSILPARLRDREIRGESFVPMAGLKIDKFYGHDDQIGPFARHIVVQSKRKNYPIRFKTSWKDPNTGDGLPVYPFAVIVPVYHKVRLRFLDVYDWVDPLHQVLRDLIPPGSKPEWDIRLQFSNDYKSKIRVDDQLSETVREALLTANHPRFWWRATLRLGHDLLELLFDATGIARSFPLNCAVWPDESFALAVEGALNDPNNESELKTALGSRYLNFLRESALNRNSPAIR
jgi:hypothetical protein